MSAASNGSGHTNGKVSGLRADRLDPSKFKPVHWLWTNRIVQDSLNLVIGNEGIGKGTFVAWLLAQVTKGKLQGRLWGEPSEVGIIGYEDSFDRVWGPRLSAVGVDIKKVSRISREDLDQIDVRRDLSELAELIQERRIKVIYFDQLLDNLSITTDHYNAKDIRGALAPIHSIAEAVGVTIIGTLHPNKRADSFRQLVQGSAAFNAIARSSLLIGAHPADEDVRVLVVAKANYGSRGHGIEFKIVSDTIKPAGRNIKTSRAIGFKKSELTVEDLMESSNGHGGKRREGVKVMIENALKVILGDGEWHGAREVIDELTDQGFSERTVQKVAEEIRVYRDKDGFQGKMRWKLVD